MSVWLLAVAGAGVMQWVVNQLLVLPAIRGADPTMRIRDMLFERNRVHNDVAELSVAVRSPWARPSVLSRSCSRCRS